MQKQMQKVKIGRPPVRNKKSKSLTIKVNIREFEEITERCNELGIGYSEYFRQYIPELKYKPIIME